MKPILVSIIIPCYNVEDYIAECLDSAIDQIYRPIEIIVVDNNSSDNTLNILRDYQRRYPDLITVLEEKRQGAPAARNMGLSIAKGEWLQFLDADDLILKEKILNQVTLIGNLPNTTMVVGAHIQKYLRGTSRICLQKKGDVYKALVTSYLGYTVSNLFKKFENNSQPLWDNNLKGGQDISFIFEYVLIKENRIVYDDVPLTITRQRPFGQITKTNPLEFNKSCVIIQLKIMNFLKVQHSVYYQKNEDYFVDNLYYYVYRIALASPRVGEDKFKELLPSGYFPSFLRENRITAIHSICFRIFGLKRYAAIRKTFMDYFDF